MSTSKTVEEPSPPTAEGDGAGRPVALDVGAAVTEPLRRWVEGVLGWQVVDPQRETLVPPTVQFVGPQASSFGSGIPRVLVLEADADPVEAVEAALRLEATAVVQWPDDREVLAARIDAVLSQDPVRRSSGAVVRIGGVAGGVGTTTIALALGGLAAWRGRPTLVTVRGDAPVAPVATLATASLGAVDLWERLPAVPGVPGLRVAHLGDPSSPDDPQDAAIGLTVFDLGVDTDVDVVVCRPDAAAVDRLPETTAGAAVIVGEGPIRRAALQQALGGRRAVVVPWSVRVARAGSQRRIPASLPGSWLRRLQPLVAELGGDGPAAR